MQGHDISESQVVNLQPGRNVAEFVLQPGLSIQGEVSWTQGTRLSGDIQAYDLQHRDTLRSAMLEGRTTVSGTEPLLAGVGYPFLIVGLLPGRYKLGVSFDAAFVPPQFWDGGGSFEDAPVIDLTSTDVTDIHVELGALPTTTTAASLPWHRFPLRALTDLNPRRRAPSPRKLAGEGACRPRRACLLRRLPRLLLRQPLAVGGPAAGEPGARYFRSPVTIRPMSHMISRARATQKSALNANPSPKTMITTTSSRIQSHICPSLAGTTA